MDLSSDQLLWGVKGSFLDYISRSGGTAGIIAPARYHESVFFFPASAVVAPIDRAFVGGVEFRAHGGLLRIVISAPAISGQGSQVLTVLTEAGPHTSRRIAIAQLEPQVPDRPSEELFWRALLTAEGARLFGDIYPEGTELDPLLMIRANRS